MNYLLNKLVFDTSFHQDKSLYAIIDAARIDRMPALLFELEEDPEYASLFQGFPQEDLFEVAPYLVKLEQRSKLLTWILTNGWGNSWGIFLSTNVELEDLLEHLQKMLPAELPNGEKLLFRFYDPRVLEVYFQNCEEDELGAFLGPTDSIIFEVNAGKMSMQLARNERSSSLRIIEIL